MSNSGASSGLTTPQLPALAVRTSSYVPLVCSGVFDPSHSSYLPGGLRQPYYNLRNGIARAQNGEDVCRIACFGDSLTNRWFKGNTLGKEWPDVLGSDLARRFGLPMTNGVAIPETDDTRQTFGSGWTVSSSCATSSTAASTYTYTTTDVGDRVVIPYWPNGTWTATVKIDGVTVAPIVVSASAPTTTGWAIYTGLTVQAHTVVITVSAGTVFIAGVGVERTGGISITSWGQPGLSTPNPSGAPFPSPGTPDMFFAAGGAGYKPQDAVIWYFGTNNTSFQTQTPAVTAANTNAEIDQLRASTTATDFAIIVPIPNGSFNSPLVWKEADTAAGLYLSAEQRLCPVIDLLDCWGTFAAGNTAGLYNADGTHLTDRGQIRMGHDIFAAIASRLAA